MVAAIASNFFSGAFATPALPSFSLGGVGASVVDGERVPAPPGLSHSADHTPCALADAKAKADALASKAQNAASVR